MQKVYIVGAKRTALGSFLGSLKDTSPAKLGSIAVKGALDEAAILPSEVDEVIVGNVLSAGAGQGIARQVAIGADVPIATPAYAINMVCGSGLKSVMTATDEIMLGRSQVIVAAGTEVMSGSPYLLPAKVRAGHKMGDFQMIDHMTNDALIDAFSSVHMGVTAENIASKYDITREEQDAFAFASQQKALTAVDNAEFEAEIVPVTVKVGRAEVEFKTDEYPNRSTSPEKLAKLRPAFKPDGSVTAGNASGINDGASAVVLAGEGYIKNHAVKPLVEVVGIGQGGVDPLYMGLGPVPAIRAALKDAGLSLGDMDILELNEAFAAQSLGVIAELSKEHGLSPEWFKERTNLRGGAIALGHPVGASGNRILVTLVHLMRQKGLRYGLASLCIGGGMGTCVILQNCDAVAK